MILYRASLSTMKVSSEFKKLMRGENGVVRFNNCVGDFWRRENGVGARDLVWVCITNLQQEQSSHARSSSSSKGVKQLESLDAIALFRFFTDDVNDIFNNLRTFSIMSFGPIVSCTIASELHVLLGKTCS